MRKESGRDEGVVRDRRPCYAAAPSQYWLATYLPEGLVLALTIGYVKAVSTVHIDNLRNL